MTECSRCGCCCDPITFNVQAWYGLNYDEGRWYIEERLRALFLGTITTESYAAMAKDADFIRKRWRPQREQVDPFLSNSVLLQCDAFDHDTRLCTARDDRPPICRNYPWYGRAPSDRNDSLPVQCSFRADQPVTVDRPVTFLGNRAPVAS